MCLIIEKTQHNSKTIIHELKFKSIHADKNGHAKSRWKLKTAVGLKQNTVVSEWAGGGEGGVFKNTK